MKISAPKVLQINRKIPFIPLLSLFIVKDRQHLRPRPKFYLSFAMKRDKKGIKAIPFGSLIEAAEI
jgi:hypothetical protein